MDLAHIPPTTTCTSCGTELPLCQHPKCGKPIPRNPHESWAKWGKREYCSIQHANEVRQLAIHGPFEAAVKPCARPGCTEKCVQRRNESPTSFEERKYHDRECASMARRHGDLSDRQRRELRRAQRAAAPRPTPLPRKRDVEVENKPLIRDVPIVHPKPEPKVWRPAAWQEMDRRFA